MPQDNSPASIDQALTRAIQRHQAGDLHGADEIYRWILQQDPDHADALHLLGMVAHQAGQHEAALDLIRRAIASDPQAVPFYNNLGGVFQALGRLPEAVQCYQRAIDLLPHFADAHYNLGNALRELGQLDEAVAAYERAVRIKPDHAEAYNNLGNALQELGRRETAVQAYRRALQINPRHAEANCNLVHQLQHLCHWDEIGARTQRIIEAVESDADRATTHSIPPLYFLVLPTPTTAEQQLRCARNWVGQRVKPIEALLSTKKFDLSRRAHDRIRLGYLSADFRVHPVGFAIVELLERHDRRRFEVIAYSFGPDDGSAVRQRIRQACDRFVDIRAETFLKSAERIHADGIDILVDLTGHTRHARTEILALRPAPVQVHYLGYPGTMGASFIDYVVADEFVIPREHEPYYAEQVARLRCCFFPGGGRRGTTPRGATRASCGLPGDGFVFCCFNNSYKIAPRLFEVWTRLLAAVPGSVLWLAEQHHAASSNLRREAARHGVTPERLVFAPTLTRWEDHLDRYRLADLFLDTFPYNAHATASDALCGGCPVLTLAGATFASRVAGSQLHAVELPELVTHSLAAYEHQALELARHPERLARLRARLAQTLPRSTLIDGDALVRGLEQAYSEMWRRYLAGQPAGTINC